MNETSRGGGDPPIGGFANPSSSTSLRLDSASHATISSSSIPGDIGGITINHDPRHTDPTLLSLGASLGSEFDAFGADNLNLTKLLNVEKNMHFDPLKNYHYKIDLPDVLNYSY